MDFPGFKAFYVKYKHLNYDKESSMKYPNSSTVIRFNLPKPGYPSLHKIKTEYLVLLQLTLIETKSPPSTNPDTDALCKMNMVGK